MVMMYCFEQNRIHSLDYCCCFVGQMLWIIPSEELRWCSVVLALCLSGSVLLLTFWPAVRDDHLRVSVACMSAILVLNILLAVVFKVINASVSPFFSYGSRCPREEDLGRILQNKLLGGGERDTPYPASGCSKPHLL